MAPPRSKPLDKAFGHTFGNSLRRVPLSSPGWRRDQERSDRGRRAPVLRRLRGEEDVTDIVLNLKDIVIRTAHRCGRGGGPVGRHRPRRGKAKDIDLPAGRPDLNPDVPIATLEKRTKLEMYLDDRPWPRRLPGQENKPRPAARGDPDRLIFSPIRRAPTRWTGAGRPADRLRQRSLKNETDGRWSRPRPSARPRRT